MSFKTRTMLAALAMGLCFTSVPAFADPELSIKSEEAGHPRIMKAIREMQEALHELKEAPHDFGGNKARAMQDTQAAIHSLKKALYFRLKMDDAAIDRAQ
jgi:hypothetical protein